MASSKSILDLSELLDAGSHSGSSHLTWNDVGYYVNLLLRFRWALIAPFCFAMAAGLYYALTVTPIYEASTLVLVSAPEVPSNIVRPVVSENLGSQTATISEQVQSRSNLEKVIAEYKLFSDPYHRDMFMEDKLNSLRKNIKVDLIQSRSAFSITFRSNDREKTMKVANALASNFIDSNLEYREEKAIGTTNFLESELETMRTKLKETESQLSMFRNKHMGELPEQLQSNLQLLSSLETQLNNRQERLRDERSRLLIAQNEVEQIRREMQNVRTAPGPSITGPPQAGVPISLPQLREQLVFLQGTYTQKHPDVVRLKNMIAEMEARESIQMPADAKSEGTSAAQALESISSPVLKEAVRRRMEAEVNIANSQVEVNQINQQIREYRLRIERTHKREEQLISINRDYENIRNAYNSLLSRKVEADMAVSMQKKNKGEQFRVVDFAKLPEKPVSPNMMNVFMLFTAAGLAIGGGIIFLFEFFDNSVRKPEVFQAKLSLPVLMVMPAMEHTQGRGSRLKGQMEIGLSIGAGLASLGLFACFAAVTVLNLPRVTETIKVFLR